MINSINQSCIGPYCCNSHDLTLVEIVVTVFSSRQESIDVQSTFNLLAISRGALDSKTNTAENEITKKNNF